MPDYSTDSILCDSSSLISLTDSCFIHSLFMLTSHFTGEFLISRAVEDECINTPMQMKAHAIHALRLKRAVNEGVVKVVDMDVRQKAEEIMYLSNNLFYLDRKPLQLVHLGEAEILALARELKLSNIMIDERTTRMLVESPETLKKHLQDEFRREIEVNDKNLARLQELTSGLTLFRSTELLIMSYEHGYFNEYKGIEKETLRAALYALKFNGCSVSFAEIDEYLGVMR